MGDLEDQLDDKTIIKSQIKIVKDAVTHSEAWKKHLKEHKDAKLVVKKEESSALFPADESSLVQQIGFDDARHFRAIRAQESEQKVEVFNADQAVRQKGIEDLGFQSERHFRFIRTDQLKAEDEQHKRAMPIYGQKEEDGRAASLYGAGSSSAASSMSAKCDCGEDFTHEAHHALGMPIYQDAASKSAPFSTAEGSQPTYAHSAPGTASSQPTYAHGHGHGQGAKYK